MKVLLLRFIDSSPTLPLVAVLDSVNALHVSKDCLEMDILPESDEFILYRGAKPFWELNLDSHVYRINQHVIGNLFSLRCNNYLDFESIIVMNDSDVNIDLMFRGDVNTDVMTVVSGASFSVRSVDFLGSQELEGSDFNSYEDRFEYVEYLASECEHISSHQLNRGIYSISLGLGLGELAHRPACSVVKAMYRMLRYDRKLRFTRSMFEMELLEQAISGMAHISADAVLRGLNTKRLGA